MKTLDALLEPDLDEWMSTLEAARLIRSFRKKDGKPCTQRIRNLVIKKVLDAKKPFGRLLVKRSQINKIIESSDWE